MIVIKNDTELLEIIDDFISGLFKCAKVTHAGNCLAVSQVLKMFLELFSIETNLINVKVAQGRKRVNHYCLQRFDGTIIDATASQFINMPKVYIGQKPNYYLLTNG